MADSPNTLPPGFQIHTPDGKPPTPEQIQEFHRNIAARAKENGLSIPHMLERIRSESLAQQAAQAEALKAEALKQGLTVPEFVAKVNAERQKVQAAAQAAGLSVEEYVAKMNGTQAAQQEAQQPITPGPPKPAALAVAKFLKMFKVKRALRALSSEAYQKARKKNSLLPEITDRASLENTFKLLPLSLLALRVTKIDPHEGHDHAPGAHKTKRVKGLWTVKIEQQQECREELHFIWLYEGSQIKQKLYAAGALGIVFAIVMFPLWPMKMRLGVWYLSMGMLGLIGLFFVMAIFRLILFVITMFTVPPGLWLYPNLFEDVGFFDSFRPVWGWQEEKKKGKGKKKAKALTAGTPTSLGSMQIPGQPAPASATTTTAPQINVSAPRKRVTAQPAQVEEMFDED